MTISAMHILFNMELKAQARHEDFAPEEIDVFLNLAIRNFIEERKPAIRQEGIALSDLRTLMDSQTLSGANVNSHAEFDNVVAVDLSALDSTFEYWIGSRAKVTAGPAWKMVQPLSYERFLDSVSGEGHAPVLRRLPGTLEGSSVLVLHDEGDGGLSDLHITYLKPPAEVELTTSTDCDLPDHAHRRVVSMSVAAAIAALTNTE